MCTASLAALINRSEAVNFITFSKQERLFYSKILFRFCGYGNKIKKAPNISRFEQKKCYKARENEIDANFEDFFWPAKLSA